MAVNEADFLTVNSDTIKSLFNDIAHDAQLMQSGQSKLSYAKSLEAVLAEGRGVPLAVQRASSAESILVKKATVLELVRAAAKVEPGDVDEGSKEIADVVSNRTDGQMVAAIDAMDKTVGETGDFEIAREKMIDLIEAGNVDDGLDLNEVKVALVALSVFEGLNKEDAMTLVPMIKRCSVPLVESEAEEDLVPEEGEEEEEEDLCAGL